MMYIKRKNSFILCLVLLFTLLISDASAAYDVQYGYAAEALWEDGLFLGSSGSFNLDKPLTRVEGAVMIVRLLGKEDEALASKCSAPFTDVPDWAAPYIGYGYEKGIIDGISATKYGSKDKMSAKQYLTLVLRALGYDDKAGDFTWDKSPSKALEIGLIGESCHTQYTTTEQFLRDNAAVISYNALSINVKGTTSPLRSTITIPGRPDGEMPAYTADAAINKGGSTAEGSGDTDKHTDKKCTSCNGLGWKLCYHCGGKGVVLELYPQYNPVTMKTDFKQRNKPCNKCTGGSNPCKTCGGDGKE